MRSSSSSSSMRRLSMSKVPPQRELALQQVIELVCRYHTSVMYGVGKVVIYIGKERSPTPSAKIRQPSERAAEALSPAAPTGGASASQPTGDKLRAKGDEAK